MAKELCQQINGKKGNTARNMYLKGNDYTDGFIAFNPATTLADLTSDVCALAFQSTTFKYWNGTTWASVSAGGGGASSWDDLYASDKTMTISSDTVTFSLTHATNDGLTLTGSGGSAGNVLQITNAGTGKDINGTSGTWSVTKAGLATFVGVTSTSDFTTTGAAVDWDLVDNNASALSFDAAGKSGIINIVTTNGSEGVSMSGYLTVTGVVTASAGVVSSEGPNTFTGTSNAAATVSIVNDTATNIGAAADLGVVQISTESITTGVLLNLSADETPMAGGYFFRCYSQDAGAAAFTIGEKGATVITGIATGTAALSITAGNFVMSDGAMSLTQSADSAALTIVADSQTTTNVVDINADGLTNGAILHLDTTVAGMNTGYFIQCYDGAADAFAVKKYGAVTITGNAGSTVFTATAGDLVVSDGSLAITDADEAETVTIVNNTVASAAAMSITANGITDGDVLKLVSSAAGMTTGNFLQCYNGAANVFEVGLYGAVTIAGNAGSNVFTVTAGDLVVSDGSLSITDADEAATFSVTNNTAASVSAVVFTANGITDGDVLKLESSAAGMTTGNFINCYNGAAIVFEVGLYGATTIAGNAGTNVLIVTAGNAVLTSGNLTLTSGNLVLTSGDATLTAGNLTLTLGNETLTDGNLTLAEGKVTVTDTADEYALSVTGNAAGTTQSVVLLKNDNAASIMPVLEISQDDTDQSFIKFTGTSGAGNSINTYDKSGGTAKYIMIKLNADTYYIKATTGA